MTSRTRAESRERILDAAVRLVVAQGAAHVTLRAVALTAGITKSGVLYQFRTKQALLEAMLDRHLDDCSDRVRPARETGGSPGPVAARLAALGVLGDQRRPLAVALLAAAAQSPALMARVRSQYSTTLEELEETPDAFAQAALLLLAADGLLLGEMIQSTGFTPDQRARVVAALRGTQLTPLSKYQAGSR